MIWQKSWDELPLRWDDLKIRWDEYRKKFNHGKTSGMNATKRAIHPTTSAKSPRKEQFAPPFLPNCHEKSNSSHRFCDADAEGAIHPTASAELPRKEQFIPQLLRRRRNGAAHHGTFPTNAGIGAGMRRSVRWEPSERHAGRSSDRADGPLQARTTPTVTRA